MLDPKVFKAYDVRGVYGSELDEEGAYAIGRGFVEEFEPPVDRSRARHAPRCADDDSRRDRGGSRRRRRRARPRHGRNRDGLPRGRVARARRRYLRHRLAQPEGVHRDEDRPPRGAPRRRRLGVGGDQAASRCGLWRGHAPRGDPRRGHLALVRRQGHVLHRGRVAPPAEDRGRCRERHGRDDAASGARATATDRGRGVLLRARRVVPAPRAEPAPAREPGLHRREDALGGCGSRGCVRRRRRSLLLRRRHGRVHPRRLRHGAARAGDAREVTRREGDLRRARELGRAAHDRGGRRHRAA